VPKVKESLRSGFLISNYFNTKKTENTEEMSHARPPRKRSVAGRQRRKGAKSKRPKGTSNIELPTSNYGTPSAFQFY